MARRKCFLKSLKFLAEDRLSQRQHLFFISWQRTPSNEEDKKGKEEKKEISSEKDFQPRKRTWMGVSSKAASISKQEKGGEKPSK
jgi:hypothetical protein